MLSCNFAGTYLPNATTGGRKEFDMSITNARKAFINGTATTKQVYESCAKAELVRLKMCELYEKVLELLKGGDFGGNDPIGQAQCDERAKIVWEFKKLLKKRIATNLERLYKTNRLNRQLKDDASWSAGITRQQLLTRMNSEARLNTDMILNITAVLSQMI